MHRQAPDGEVGSAVVVEVGVGGLGGDEAPARVPGVEGGDEGLRSDADVVLRVEGVVPDQEDEAQGPAAVLVGVPDEGLDGPGLDDAAAEAVVGGVGLDDDGLQALEGLELGDAVGLGAEQGVGDDEVLDAPQAREARAVGHEVEGRVGGGGRGDGEVDVVEVGHGVGLGGVGEVGADVGDREGVAGGGELRGVDGAGEEGLGGAGEEGRPDREAVDRGGDGVGVVGVPDDTDADLGGPGGAGREVGQVEVPGGGVPARVGPGPAGEQQVPLPGVGPVGEAGDVQGVLARPG